LKLLAGFRAVIVTQSRAASERLRISSLPGGVLAAPDYRRNKVKKGAKE
jgi:hypothetical protein